MIILLRIPKNDGALKQLRINIVFLGTPPLVKSIKSAPLPLWQQTIPDPESVVQKPPHLVSPVSLFETVTIVFNAFCGHFPGN